MKRAGDLIEKIADLDNIALGAYKAFRGKSRSAEVMNFRKDFLDNIFSLRYEILDNRIEVGDYNEFVIYEPKKRLICAAPLRQRIIHHAIMNVCHDIFDRQLIFDSYASRPGKGSHSAIKRLKYNMGKYKYFVKLDVRKFFESVNHDVLRELLEKIFKDYRLLNIFSKIIDSYGKIRGLPIGNLTSQYFANYYLSPLDHYMKETQKAPFYIRYMDDVVIMCNEKKELMSMVFNYCLYASDSLKLQIKPPLIGRVCKGIPFLGYKVYRERILMNGKGKRRFRKKIKLLERLYEEGEITDREYSTRLMGVLAYARFADSQVFRKRILG